ncbi:MAG: carbohydrate ABC transporter permease [Anaerolineae bacterium]|jgi:multiple sugar transport system permease protein|nr:carbohydrate ABC transporter permease [Anaerolineae bacterium]
MAAITSPSKTTTSNAVNTSPFYSVQLRKFAVKAMITMLAFVFALAYLLPFGNMALIAVKSTDQITGSTDSNILPLSPRTFTYALEGEDAEPYDIFEVPQEDGTVKELALIRRGRQDSDFIDPANPDAGLINWQGSWRTLDQAYELDFHFENFGIAWDLINFPRLFFNTLAIAMIGLVGTLLSSICVAYAFARFPIPGKNVLFIALIGTIILPSQVTLIPTYAFFASIGWTGTWLPLIVPHFFANAYNVFLLRQFFMTLPRELDEAAMIDGAGPFRVLISVIIPQAWPAIISVGLFHFLFAWNDYFGPLIYLLGKPELVPISVGVQVFNFQYGPRPELVQATSLMAMVLPLLIFIFAQKIFMRGVVITGVDK